MKFALLFILAYFCLNQVTLSSAVSFKNEESGQKQFPGQRKTKLDDLSVELQLMMLENLNLIELLNMSSTNEYYHQLGADVFRRKIEAKTIVFGRRPHYDVEQFEIASMNKESIYIENYDVMLKMLKIFGHLLTTLKIDYGCVFDVERRKQITEYASEYCSETLLELNIDSYRGFKLDYFPLSFKKLEKLSVNYMTLEADEATLDQKFPTVRQLILKNSLITKESVSGGSFSHLEHLSIDNESKKGKIESLILKSPHLQSLEVVNFPYDLLSFVSDNAPQLVELKLFGMTFKNESYYYDVKHHFKNVKKLFLYTNCNPPKHFVFDQLEELRIDGSYHFGNEWLDFTVKNTNLKRFEFVPGWLDDEKLGIIADNLKNLEEARIRCASSVQTGAISHFVRNNDKLKRLKVIISKSMSSSLQASLRNEWNFIEKLENGSDVELHFEKKSEDEHESEQ